MALLFVAGHGAAWVIRAPTKQEAENLVREDSSDEFEITELSPEGRTEVILFSELDA